MKCLGFIGLFVLYCFWNAWAVVGRDRVRQDCECDAGILSGDKRTGVARICSGYSQSICMA